jgi:hypothetical protein
VSEGIAQIQLHVTKVSGRIDALQRLEIRLDVLAGTVFERVQPFEQTHDFGCADFLALDVELRPPHGQGEGGDQDGDADRDDTDDEISRYSHRRTMCRNGPAYLARRPPSRQLVPRERAVQLGTFPKLILAILRASPDGPAAGRPILRERARR